MSADFLTETWFIALLGSMVAVMVLLFAAMLYVRRRHMMTKKSLSNTPRSNGAVLNTPLSLKASIGGGLGGLPYPFGLSQNQSTITSTTHAMDPTNLWLDKDQLSQTYTPAAVPDYARLTPNPMPDYAEVDAIGFGAKLIQSDNAKSPAPYATTTLIGSARSQNGSMVSTDTELRFDFDLLHLRDPAWPFLSGNR